MIEKSEPQMFFPTMTRFAHIFRIIDLLAKLFCVQEWNKRNNNRTPTKRGLAFPRLMETKPRSHNIEGLDFLGLGNPNPTLKRKISETDEKASDNLR